MQKSTSLRRTCAYAPVIVVMAFTFLANRYSDIEIEVTSYADDTFVELAPISEPERLPSISVESGSSGCVTCHKDARDPHYKDTVQLSCVDCHGGDATALTKEKAHVHPRFPEAWRSSANPVRSYTLLNRESRDFVRFVNPGDFRVARETCGTTKCHPSEVQNNKKSMMTHGCMLWGAALYNNGAVPFKRSRYGESYSEQGNPQRLQTFPPPTPIELEKKGVIPFLDPLPRFENSQPANVLRIFERGGKIRTEIGIPDPLEDPGRPFLSRLSNRGLGTENRTDPVFIGLQKTRLLDPTLNFLGTNDHSGDYRSSGCTSCHMVYANDTSPIHSGPYAKYGKHGTAAAETDDFVVSVDPTIPKDEPGHPITHRFAPGNAIPTSQCIVCHVHPGTSVMNSYLGYMWWDVETDGHLMYPEEPRRLTPEQIVQAQFLNPDENAVRGLWSDPDFLDQVSSLNPHTERTVFADFQGHGWPFRAVFKKDRKGNYLDAHGKILDPTNGDFNEAVKFPEKVQAQLRAGKSDDELDRNDRPVHLMDVHLEKGMHCVDCHFTQDNHGNGRLQAEVRAAIEIQCIDCHGDISSYAKLRTSGPAAYTSDPAYVPGYDVPNPRGRDLTALKTPFGKPRFERRGTEIIQNSMVDKSLSWKVTQVRDTINPTSTSFNMKASLAKTIRFEKGQLAWGDAPVDDPDCKFAHGSANVSCIACHSSWNTTCYGCHLPQKANFKSPMLHNEGTNTLNHVFYNWQTLRDDVFMLARDGDVTGNRIGPVRSACAIHVGSYNQNREAVYIQQQTISSEGLSGIAFSTNVPHTVRGGPPSKLGIAEQPDVAYEPGRSETKSCTDCHISIREDNNAIMAQLLMQGTNNLNFIGRYCWIAAGEHGIGAAIVTEQSEPQAVIGSNLHQLAYPHKYKKHVKHDYHLHLHEHPGKDIIDNALAPGRGVDVHNVQARGEYLYAACGKAGLKVFDIAFIDHKGFSERIVTAPVSPLGQKFYVETKYANFVAAPSTTAVDPTRTHLPENREPTIHPLYGYLYIADKYEGLILVGAATLLDGNPLNNFLKRDVTFNPNGILKGAKHVAIVGAYAYVSCDRGIVVVSIDNPKMPKVVSVVDSELIHKPTSVQVQFRYAFVCAHEQIAVLDVTDLANPKFVTSIEVPDPHNIYVARTYAYVACGKHGLYILDVENPREPKLDQVFTADGCINDLHDVKLGIAYSSQFAYLADGKNGMRVVQLTSPHTPGNDGFSPRPTPQLIATAKLPRGGHAHAISEGLDRDRAVDESGNQLSVFGRIGARPLNLQEQRKLYIHDGRLYRVSDDPRDWRVYPEPRPYR